MRRPENMARFVLGRVGVKRNRRSCASRAAKDLWKHQQIFAAPGSYLSASGTALGWIFSIFELATLVGTPITTRLLVRSGSKPILVAGNFLGGLANILNGLCWYVGDGAPFIVSCLLLRVVAGFAFSFESTAGYSLLSALFGQNVSTATGILEGVNGLAMILGPIVGSSLYSMAGGDSHMGTLQ
ncbi:SLC18B1 [Symbiodinium natans]|uniref:SLC18B1 protein n=1 Tax=Symbiodinium natans TaxID=878477 RepID=A0A812L6M0_9DINO|nr:SLC18B1 [Symbiodinium natans]